MNEKYIEADAWLEKIFGGQPVPKYEINGFTLDTFAELMQQNRCQDSSAELVIQDLHQKAEEYEIEAERYSKVLQKLGLSSDSLSQSGNISLKTLVDVSSVLDVRTPSQSNIMLAMSEAFEERLSQDDVQRLEETLSAQLFTKTKAQLQHTYRLKKVLETLEEQANVELSELEKKAKTAEFLHSKSKEYLRSFEQLKRELASVGVEPSIYHTTLVKRSEELKTAKEKLHSLKAKLDSYHALPPDLSLARVRVEEAKAELASLEAELAQCIDLMHLCY